jgi:hypothetical protein
MSPPTLSPPEQDGDPHSNEQQDAVETAELGDERHREIRRLLAQEADPRAGAIVDGEELLMRGEHGEGDVAGERGERATQKPARFAAVHQPPIARGFRPHARYAP